MKTVTLCRFNLIDIHVVHSDVGVCCSLVFKISKVAYTVSSLNTSPALPEVTPCKQQSHSRLTPSIYSSDVSYTYCSVYTVLSLNYPNAARFCTNNAGSKTIPLAFEAYQPRWSQTSYSGRLLLVESRIRWEIRLMLLILAAIASPNPQPGGFHPGRLFELGLFQSY